VLLDLLNIFINNIAPILLIASAGVFLRRQLNVDPRPLSTTMFYILSPSLVFWSLYAGEVGGGEFFALFFGTVIFQGIMAMLAYGIASIWRIPPIERSSLILASFCMNAGNFGLPLVAFAFGEEAAARAVVVLVANVLTNYSIGVYVASNGRSTARDAFKDMMKTPALYAFTLAMILRVLNVEIPVLITRPVESLADAAIPMMLVVLGLQLGAVTQIKRIPLLATGVNLRLLLSPFIAFGLAMLLRLDGLALTAFMIQASMPTAVLTIILATEFDLDRDLMLNLILATTLISPITLSVLILLLQNNV